jgi:hypothetical protein
MDASKLQNILLDLTSDEEEIITETLNALVNNISANQSVEISTNLTKLKDTFLQNNSNEYNQSNSAIVESIGASSYFGISGFQKIDEILKKNSFNVQKTVADLQKYITERTAFVTLINATSENLKKLNVNPHFHNDNTFEVGILMPKDVTDNKIINVTKELNQWDKVFKTIKELTGSPIDDTEINFVNNGSLQFFIDNGPQIAACLAVTIERITKLYKSIIEIRSAKEKLKELGVSTGDQKNIEKQEKEIFNKGIDSITADIIKEFAIKQIESGRINELKIAMKGHVTYIAKCIDKGMTIEINPPEISEPAESKETDTAEKKEENKKLKENYDLTLKKIEVVQKSMDTVKSIGKTGVDIIKYLTEGETKDEE